MTELNDEDIAKAIGQFALALNPLLEPLRRYGQGVYVDLLAPELINWAWQLHWRLEGVDIPPELPNLRYPP